MIPLIPANSTGRTPAHAGSRASRTRSSCFGSAVGTPRPTAAERAAERMGRPGRLQGASDEVSYAAGYLYPIFRRFELVASGPASLPKIHRRTAHINGFSGFRSI